MNMKQKTIVKIKSMGMSGNDIQRLKITWDSKIIEDLSVFKNLEYLVPFTEGAQKLKYSYAIK
jgi:hypothetical protein